MYAKSLYQSSCGELNMSIDEANEFIKRKILSIQIGFEMKQMSYRRTLGARVL